jgi:hypothetical protein
VIAEHRRDPVLPLFSRKLDSRNDIGLHGLPSMTHIIFSDYRNPAAEQAYEIAWDFLSRSGSIRDEFEACVFLAQRVSTMVDRGETNRIRMANRAISEYEQYVDERDMLVRCGRRADGM